MAQVQLLSAELNADVMLLAARAVTFLADVMPATASSIVRQGAVPVLCARLLSIDYIDLAEQSLQALNKLSLEHPQARHCITVQLSCLSLGGSHCMHACKLRRHDKHVLYGKECHVGTRAGCVDAKQSRYKNCVQIFRDSTIKEHQLTPKQLAAAAVIRSKSTIYIVRVLFKPYEEMVNNTACEED